MGSHILLLKSLGILSREGGKTHGYWVIIE